MKRSKFSILALGIVGFAAAVMTGCDKYETYVINSPDDLQSKIDSIASANNPQRGDTLKLDINIPFVGADDNTAAWWTEFSDYFPIPANRMLHLEFINHTSGEGNWNNWNLAVTTADVRDGSNYSEYFVLRSDAYGWGNSDYDAAMINIDYDEKLPGDDMWAVFRSKMEGAHVSMDIDHSRTGNVFVTVLHKATDGTEFTETYQQPVSATDDIQAFLIVDGSHLEIKSAYTITSKHQVVEDVEATSITASGYPEAIEIGTEDFWGNATATVTFADGSSTEVGFDDLTFTVPDLTTPGTKTIIYTYNKTKQGNIGTPVSGFYTLEVNNAVTGIEITTLPRVTTYYFYDNAIAPVNINGIEVSATYADGSKGALPVASVTASALEPKAGEQDVTVTYTGKSDTFSATYTVQVVQGTALVGVADCSTPWWTAFTADAAVPSGASHTFHLTLLSDGLENWHAPCVILRRADLTEYGVLRMDHFGWGASYDGNANLVAESNWDWDTFKTSLNGSEVTITVTNTGDGIANVRYDVVYPNGEEHFQEYKGLPVDSSDLQAALVTEGSCLIMHD